MKIPRDEHGQDLVEYALIVAAVALGMVAAVNQLGIQIMLLYEYILLQLNTLVYR